ncbi:ExeM/NucH family extracellular endonuclease [Dapis sp. BLCC M126]|uniref:ExeM/NucH family extracellular endonuclease n=1 Tax=Dapis sp. BLCC M126 TaxID=3400189 RepID=UPI003CF03A79
MATLFIENFETDGNGTRYNTSIPEFSDGSGDFFTRTDGSNIGSFYQVSNPEGSFYFAAQDIDGEGAASEQTLTFSGIDIAGFTNLNFSTLLAEDDDGTNQDWDISDFVLFEYQIDGGGFTNLLGIESIPDGDAFNAVPAQDTDFDGNGDGTEVTDTFASFSSAIAGTGSTLDIRITFDLNAGDEDIALDNIEITGDSGSSGTTTALISEFKPNPIGTDPAQTTFELSGTPGDAFDGVIVSIESDPGSANPGDINNFASVSGTFDASGLLTVNIPDLENPSFTVALLSDFTGSFSTDIDTNDDGLPDDLSTFGTVFDAIGVPDTIGDEAFLYGTDLGGIDFTYTGDEPRLIFRDASVGDLYAINDPDNGQVFDINGIDVTPGIFDTDPTIGTDTFGTINPSVGSSASNPVINEVYVSHDGTDNTEFIEIFGTPGTSLDSLSIIGVEGDSGSPIGTIDAQFDFDSTHIIGDNGFFLVGNPTGLANNYAVAPNAEINNNFLENSSSTFALVETSSISGTSVTGSEVVIDTVALTDGDAGDTFFFDAPVIGPDGPFFPAGARRVTDGVDTDTASDFVISDFFLGADNTPTAGTFDNGGGGGGTGSSAFIHEIQGSGASSPLEGQTVTIEAVVVGDYQDGASGTNGDLNGFFLQEEDADADTDPLTSEGIFIFDGDSPAVDVNIGDVVEVTGTVDEFFGLTQLTDVSVSIQGTDTLPTPATVNFPVTTVEDLEAFEGMGITIPDTLFVTEYFNLDRFGEVVLSSDGASNEPGTDGRLEQFTDFNAPDAADFAAYQEAIATRRIVLDDGQTVQNPQTIIHGRGGNPLSATNTLRGGDTVDNLSGVLSFGFGDYRIQPVEPIDFQATNPRPETPEDVGGDLKVAALNVLNFFTTLDETGNPGSGPNGLSPRGADNQAEFDRQVEKLVTTLEIMDADIVGLVELENEFGADQNGDGQFAIETLVDELNNRVGAGTYAYVDPGVPFVDTSDAISVGAIYKTDSVQVAPGTTVEILTDSDLSDLGLSGTVFDGPSTNRAPMAVTFEELGTGERFTVSVNHFKSKGGTGSGDDADIGDGQGNFNGTRLRGSEALNAWLNTDPTGSGDSDFLIVGDLNAYAEEDPITFLEAEGYTDIAQEFVGNSAYSFTFDGQLGTLDYALANSSLINQVTGATEWHVNADEPDALDYNLDFGRDPSLFNGQDPFRNSDHDPIIVGLNLERKNELPNAADDEVSTDEDTSITGNVLTNDTDPEGDDLTVTEVNGQTADVGTEIILASGALLTVQADGSYDYDPNGQFESLNDGNTDTDSFTYTIDDGNGGTDTATVTVTIDGVDEAPELPPNILESDYRIFSHNINTTEYTVDLDNSQPVYKIDDTATNGSVNEFLTEAVLELGGTVVRNGTINVSSLEHFGGNHNPSITENEAIDEVTIKIAGSGVGGQFKADFDNDGDANAFQTFARDLLGKDPRKTEIFEFNGGTNGGNNRIRIFTNDEIIGLNPELSDGLRTADSLDFTWSGSDTSGTQKRNNFDDFIGEMGDIFGGDQLTNADIHVIPTLNEAELTETEVEISNGIGGSETWNFGNEQEAQNFLTFFNSTVEAFAV